MRHQPLSNTQFFFSTALMPCPYLPGRMERRIVTELIGRDSVLLHEQLCLAGFRRSHSIAYAAACSGCDACKAVRVVSRAFKPSRSQRRIWNRNKHLKAQNCLPVATDEQYQLFSSYQQRRHGDGDMAKMDICDYKGLIENSPVDTALIEFRDTNKRLVAACLMDRMDNGLSAVYSFFDPNLERLSLGSYMILWLINQAKCNEVEYVYLGFWIQDCDKMSYKARFQPLEIRTPIGWQSFATEAVSDCRQGNSWQSATQENITTNLTFDDLL